MRVHAEKNPSHLQHPTVFNFGRRPWDSLDRKQSCPGEKTAAVCGAGHGRSFFHGKIQTPGAVIKTLVTFTYRTGQSNPGHLKTVDYTSKV